MQTDQLSSDTVRTLAGTRPERGRVLSVYLDLDPSEFGTAPARASLIRSLVDQAQRAARETEGLSHDERTALNEDVERVEGFLTREFSADGAHGMAVFCSSPAELFQAIKLPRAVETAVVIGRTPHVEPLAGLLQAERWGVALVNRRAARLFSGTADVLSEDESFVDDVHGQHDQGGLSQRRYEESVEREKDEHLKAAADRLHRRLQREGFDHLLIGAPVELRHELRDRLHPDLGARFAGFVEVDVEHSSPDDVRRACAVPMQERRRAREHAALGRMVEGARAGGRGSTGLDDVLGALNERRVEILLLEEGFSAPGVVCASCGWAGATSGESCPVDAGDLEARDDIAPKAIELALAQAAEVMIVRQSGDLAEYGSIGAVLRF